MVIFLKTMINEKVFKKTVVTAKIRAWVIGCKWKKCENICVFVML